MHMQNARLEAALSLLRQAKPSTYSDGVILTGHEARQLIESGVLRADEPAGSGGTAPAKGWIVDVAQRHPNLSVVVEVAPSFGECTPEVAGSGIRVVELNGAVDASVFVQEVLPLYANSDDQEARWHEDRMVEFFCWWE